MDYGTLVVVVDGRVVELVDGIGTHTVTPGGGSVTCTVWSTHIRSAPAGTPAVAASTTSPIPASEPPTATADL